MELMSSMLRYGILVLVYCTDLYIVSAAVKTDVPFRD